ncbi:TonB-dependent receptor [Pseudomonas sp. GX19020]|uniref:TonB-dependent receptor n=1 Tax=Pseudomonas sp. GX19020 TaxID=2942277 RepID=UPI0020185F5B|nr:TonB-dependent receptor [Pseudomonas sp. GX19020]MCL4068683.1 TonB-dependent receptor [Pseudomonas sp. GX19020]
MPSISRRTSVRLLLTLTALTPIAAAPVLAEETTIGLGTIWLPVEQDTGLNLDATAPTASRLGEKIRDIPAAVEVIGTETMAERGLHSITAAVSQTATGITATGAPHFDNHFAARGFQGTSSVMMLFDGTRQFPGRGNISFPVDSWLIEEFEVLKGGGSVIHGHGAIGGFVNAMPKRPFDGAPRHLLTALAGSDGRLRFGADSGGSLSDTLSYRIAVIADGSDGWIDGADDSLGAVTAALSWKATPDLTFTLSADYAKREPMTYYGTPLRNGILVAGTETLNYNVEDAKTDFTDHWLQLKAEWAPSDSVRVSAVLYRIGSDRSFRNAETYEWDPVTDTVSVGEFVAIDQDQDQTGFRLDAGFRHGIAGYDSHTVIGFDLNRSKSGYASAFNSGSVTVDPFNPRPGRFPASLTPVAQYRSTLDQRAVFLENRTDLGQGLTLSLGLRQDWFDLSREGIATPATSFDASYKAPSARVALSWAANETTVVYGQLAWSTDPVNMPLMDYATNFRDFDLTTGRQFEIGMRQSFADGRAEWSLTAYDIVKRNVPVLAPGSFTLQQAGQQSSRGIELAASATVTDTLRLSGNIARTKARFDDFTFFDFNTFSWVDYSGNVPILVPETSANLWASWGFADAWTAHLGVQFVGKAWYDYANTEKRGSFSLINAGLDWQAGETSTLSLRVTNLFDKSYAAYLYPEKGQVVLGAPRRFELQLTSKF